jgi:hypothetical protein
MRRDQLAELSQRLESGKGKIVGLDDVDMDLATPAPKVGPSKISKKRRKAAKSDAGFSGPGRGVVVCLRFVWFRL